ncbi:hypothetical protein [Microvirga aerophila]|uniref:hypothetical protein n=1 Tax=Microvirga aerophila TaxID=670291 RepID=UPI0011BDD60B|nr:hypothetical protein [Microvirga aerophila]
MKIVAVLTGVVIACGAGIDLFFRFHSPFPPLASGLPHRADEAEREFNRRLNERFPANSSEAILKTVLKQEGWGEQRTLQDTHYVSLMSYASLIIKAKATIAWRANNEGRLIEIRGRYGLIGP